MKRVATNEKSWSLTGWSAVLLILVLGWFMLLGFVETVGWLLSWL